MLQEAASIAESQEAWASAHAAEKLTLENCIAHFRSVSEQVALRGTPAKTPSALPPGRLQPLPAFDLQTALQRLPSQSSVPSPR